MAAQSLLTSILVYDPAFEPAARAWKQMQAQIPEYVAAQFKDGYLKFLQGDDESARQDMSRVLHFRPGHKPAAQYHSAALERIEEKIRRRHIREQYQEGLSRYRLGRWTEALALFQNVLRLDATHPVAGVLIDQVAELQNMSLLTEEMQLESEQFLKRGRAAFLDGNMEKAEILVSTSLALWPGNSAGQYLLNRIAAGHNQKLRGLLEIGDKALARGEVDRAVATWQDVLERDPGNLDARHRLQRAMSTIHLFVLSTMRSAAQLEEAGQTVEAYGQYARVLGLDPFHPTALERHDELRQRFMPNSIAHGEFNRSW